MPFQDSDTVSRIKISGEQKAINKVLIYGAMYGYGNMIERLKFAWVRHLLINNGDMDVRTAFGRPFMGECDVVFEQFKYMTRDEVLAWLNDYLDNN